MKKLISKRIIFFGGVILLLAALGCSLLWNRVLSRDIASRHQNAKPASDQAHRPVAPFPLESGDAVGWIEDWQDSVRNNDPSIVRGSPLEAAQSLRNNAESVSTFYQ
jgi:hypothetical protein